SCSELAPDARLPAHTTTVRHGRRHRAGRAVLWPGRRDTMWRQLRPRRPQIRWRTAVAAVALLGQVTTAFGIPLPALPRARDFSRPFPCMDHPCGCHDADECWAGCCCLSDAEKLAWCEAKGVEPPSFVRRNAERELAQAKKKCCCCCKDEDCGEHGKAPESE